MRVQNDTGAVLCRAHTADAGKVAAAADSRAGSVNVAKAATTASLAFLFCSLRERPLDALRGHKAQIRLVFFLRSERAAI